MGVATAQQTFVKLHSATGNEYASSFPLRIILACGVGVPSKPPLTRYQRLLFIVGLQVKRFKHQ
jgi:hypothetical protein